MISPASFNFYQECIARAYELFDKADKPNTPTIITEDLYRRGCTLLREVPFGILESD